MSLSFKEYLIEVFDAEDEIDLEKLRERAKSVNEDVAMDRMKARLKELYAEVETTKDPERRAEIEEDIDEITLMLGLRQKHGSSTQQ